MQKISLPTVILRHRRENLKKCSLRGLEKREDLLFFSYPEDPLPDLSHYILLKVGAPELSPADCNRGLFLIDATWRLAPIMERQLPWKLEERSLPSHFRTVYPRRQTNCPDPNTGLASIEALFIAHQITGKSIDQLLDHYHWKKEFLQSLAKMVEKPTPHFCSS